MDADAEEEPMALLRLLVLFGMVLPGVVSAQDRPTTESPAIRAAFESDQLRVQHVSLAPGERTELRDHENALLIPFTADLDGRISPGDLTWHVAGTTSLENRGARTFHGILVELTASPPERPASLPPEVAADRVPDYRPVHRIEGHRVHTLLDNPRVLVTRHRLPAWQRQAEPKHVHPREVVLVYLKGGEISGSTGRLGARSARRGEFDVLPANVPHAFRNAGNDPLEFLMIAMK
jgi:quercetin dioxygenase-like cupin family protein